MAAEADVLTLPSHHERLLQYVTCRSILINPALKYPVMHKLQPDGGSRL